MSIFDDDANKMTGNWWRKEKIGDKLEGTFENKKKQINQMSGNEQNIYEIRIKNGDLYLVGGNIGIDSQMQNVKVGQIVGFEFTEERPNKKNPALNATKVIQVYANPKIIDEEWLAQRKKLEESQPDPVTVEEAEEIMNGPEEEIKIEDVEGDKTEAPFLTESEKKKLILQITELATSKLGATDGEDVKNKVMESSMLAFIDNNLSKIVEHLESLPERK